MTILIATDSFKDALTAEAVCRAIERGLKRADSEINTRIFPLADGGEGTAAILTFHNDGQTITKEVNDPLFRPVEASYGLSADGRTAFIDMAEASGLQLLEEDERNPLLTSTYGTGELIADALARGARRVVLGIGGSATNDCGTGMAAALGYRFLDEKGEELKPIGKNLINIRKIVDEEVTFSRDNIDVEVISDVDNPLYGPDGAAYIYAPQKGADGPTVTTLDKGLRRFAGILDDHFNRSFSDIPGAGAAGGMGAGAVAFIGAELRPGIDAIIEYTGFDEALQDVDLLITGEGRLDAQTAHGKLIHGICRRARKAGIPVIALCGALDAAPEQTEEIGLQAAFSILDRPISLKEALNQTERALEQTAFQLMRVLTL